MHPGIALRLGMGCACLPAAMARLTEAGAVALLRGVLGYPSDRNHSCFPQWEYRGLGVAHGPASIARSTGREVIGNSENLEIMLDFKETILESFSAHQV